MGGNKISFFHFPFCMLTFTRLWMLWEYNSLKTVSASTDCCSFSKMVTFESFRKKQEKMRWKPVTNIPVETLAVSVVSQRHGDAAVILLGMGSTFAPQHLSLHSMICGLYWCFSIHPMNSVWVPSLKAVPLVPFVTLLTDNERLAVLRVSKLVTILPNAEIFLQLITSC